RWRWPAWPSQPARVVDLEDLQPFGEGPQGRHGAQPGVGVAAGGCGCCAGRTGTVRWCDTTRRSTTARPSTTATAGPPIRRDLRLFLLRNLAWTAAEGSWTLGAAPASSPCASPACSRKL